MKELELLKSTPVRLATTFSFLFTLTSLALFAILYLGIGSRLEENIRHRTKQTSEALASLDNEKTFDDLIDVIDEESSSIRDSDFILQLVDKNGRFLAGNVQNVKYFYGWKRLKRSEVFQTASGSSSEEDFVALWKPLSKGDLLVGTSDREVRQLHTYLWKILILELLFLIFITASVSIYLAIQARRRILVFTQTLSALSEGKMESRIPMTGSGDDVDQVAAKVNSALTLLQKLVENVNQSSSDIAHDLKKPIGRLRQRLDEAARSCFTIQDFQTVLQEAIKDLDSVTETFDALLRIAQIEAGARKSLFKTLELGRVLQDVEEVYAPVAEDAGHTMVLNSISDGPMNIRGDDELIVQLVANLIENSVCHCPKGSLIQIGLQKDETNILLTVSDNGPGIPEEERENVLRRLYRLEASRSTPGSGLGLSLASAIAHLHEATLTLSDNHPGLKVTVRFPKFSGP